MIIFAPLHSSYCSCNWRLELCDDHDNLIGSKCRWEQHCFCNNIVSVALHHFDHLGRPLHIMVCRLSQTSWATRNAIIATFTRELYKSRAFLVSSNHRLGILAVSLWVLLDWYFVAEASQVKLLVHENGSVHSVGVSAHTRTVRVCRFNWRSWLCFACFCCYRARCCSMDDGPFYLSSLRRNHRPMQLREGSCLWLNHEPVWHVYLPNCSSDLWVHKQVLH